MVESGWTECIFVVVLGCYMLGLFQGRIQYSIKGGAGGGGAGNC